MNPDQDRGWVKSIAYSSDGKLASASLDTVNIWNTHDGQLLDTLFHKGNVLTVCYSPDGEQLASGSTEYSSWGNPSATVNIWNCDSKHLSYTFNYKNQEMIDVGYNPDGTQFAVFTHSYCRPSTLYVYEIFPDVHDLEIRQIFLLKFLKDYYEKNKKSLYIDRSNSFLFETFASLPQKITEWLHKSGYVELMASEKNKKELQVNLYNPSSTASYKNLSKNISDYFRRGYLQFKKFYKSNASAEN